MKQDRNKNLLCVIHMFNLQHITDQKNKKEYRSHHFYHCSFRWITFHIKYERSFIFYVAPVATKKCGYQQESEHNVHGR